MILALWVTLLFAVGLGLLSQLRSFGFGLRAIFAVLSASSGIWFLFLGLLCIIWGWF